MKGFFLLLLLAVLIFPMWALAVSLILIILLKVVGMFASASGLQSGQTGTRRSE